MTDAERLRRAIGGVTNEPCDKYNEPRITAICRAIVEEFGLKRDQYGADMNRAQLEGLVDAILDVAEGK